MADNKILDLETFIHMISNGIKLLVEKYKYIDELNVFPVPDGDTGTNMKITFDGGHKAIQGVEFADFFLLGKTFNRGLLMNARGNSGVISSQIFKGFFKSIPEGKKELNIKDLVECFKGAKETAYKAVITPVEGTILTVIRTVAETISVKLSIIKNLNDLFELITESAEKALANTPNLLPELKEAGVVDSGGYGLCRIFEGMRAVLGEETSGAKKDAAKAAPVESKTKTKAVFAADKIKETKFEDNNEGFGYCNEFIMEIGSKVTHDQKNKEKFDFTYFKKQLAKMGDSMVCVVDDDLVKLHIHSPSPWKIFDFASNYGEFLKIKVENMTQQWLAKNPGETLESLHRKHELSEEFKAGSDNIKTIVTVPSKEIMNLFTEKLGVHLCINTSGTGAPSVDTFYQAIKKVDSSKVILILDDSNYYLSARQAIDLLPTNVKCEVYNARSIVTSEFLCSLINYSLTFSANKKALWAGIKKPEVCKISKSTKDGRFNKTKVSKGDFIGIVNKKIVKSNTSLFLTTRETINWMIGEGKKFKECTIFCDTETTHATDIGRLTSYIKTNFHITPEVHKGNIENYPFTIGFIK